MPVIELEVPDAEAMQALGERLATVLRPGDLVLLGGDLGAGKTTLTQGIGAGMGVRGPIASPTFIIARVHPSLVEGAPLVHVDAYRLGDWDELEDLDLEATLDEAVTVVEWGEGFAEGLAGDRLEIHIDRSTSASDEAADVRRVRIARVGTRWDDADLNAVLSP
ncbi:tRNA (adenosine(37)-N6)-threonylcarbamoyltransferase complex ATPase subunit type 1 TsaE [Phytoactinopolyspora halotolerans]|uniref:tRNA threonylcarbamoyladenosine biosynthesis protein TsaE n=2 Tax=Phytoactinopolyspora halotolerans TaxID=1981512 RepID=A0A6L9S5Y3_9ACTN|nr:tRNA (adenosine(37)-N6)-threonylcarbamoyltransferase complex ATPase subunit type 1 TsaE [Phytoactinopolyspora halotolerans]